MRRVGEGAFSLLRAGGRLLPRSPNITVIRTKKHLGDPGGTGGVMDSSLFVLIFPFMVIIVIGVFLLLIISSHQKLEIEQDKKPLYSSTAGGQIGGLRYKGPFISLRIYDEFIVIGCGRKIVLKYDEIEAVEIKQWLGLVPDRIKIIHRNPNAPKNIVIGTGNPAEAKRIIDVRLRK